MISTIESKEHQLASGFYSTGSGPIEILIVGSCRTLAYTDYLRHWNETGGQNQFTIRRIDPCDWVVSGVNIDDMEKDERILAVLKSSCIFIHEHLQSYGFCNTSRECDKNIYKFGIDVDTDIAIPNFHDRMVLFNDYTDYGVPCPPDYIEKGEEAIRGFCTICSMSSIPEMADYFADNWRSTRFFYRPNHVSAAFTLYVFRQINDKFLHLPLTGDFWNEVSQWDLFKDPHTEVTQQDIDGYGLRWS